MQDNNPDNRPFGSVGPRTMTRRTVLGAGAGLAAVSLVPLPVQAAPEDARAAIIELFGTADIQDGKVTLELPPISENGFSVPLSVSVESPMIDEDYVRRIGIISERNPVATVAQFHLGPASGKAVVSTRIRLAGTQIVHAVAEMNDGSLWSGRAETLVTLAACVIL